MGFDVIDVFDERNECWYVCAFESGCECGMELCGDAVFWVRILDY